MAVNYIPENCHAVTPYLIAPDAVRLIEFLEQAFDGVESEKVTRPDGTILHAQVRIADSLLMLGQKQAGMQAYPIVLYLYVPDCDAVYQRSVAAGAESQVQPCDMF